MHFVNQEYHVIHHDKLEGSKPIVERSVVFEEYPDVSFKKGDFISIDGARGEVIEGEKELEPTVIPRRKFASPWRRLVQKASACAGQSTCS